LTFLLLNLITASRSVLCPVVWFWCWRKRPRRMVLWMVLAFAYFLVTDHYDGQWAREYGLESRLGYWLDHLGDFLFYGVVVLSIIRGSTEPPLARRRTKGGAGAPSAVPMAPAKPASVATPPTSSSPSSSEPSGSGESGARPPS
jgi:hypothetical protein